MTGGGDVDREPLRAHFTALIGGDRKLLPRDDESLVDEGILDSFGLSELIALLDRAYGVRVPDGDIALQRFESIDTIAAYVAAARR